jgi:DNA primase
MDNKYFVLGLLESVLGKGKKSKNDDYDFFCPFCKHRKPKLVVNVTSGMFNCWTCHPHTKGRSPIALLKKLNVDSSVISEMKNYFKDNTKIKLDQDVVHAVSLPKEFIGLENCDATLKCRHALAYLNTRGITLQDIIKYNIGYCESGKYKDRIIIPSYDKDYKLNYFIARSINEETFQKYDAPKCKKAEIIGFENTINWEVPIVLCEGAFDAIAVKRNAIPLFGKTIPKSIMMKLAMTSVKTVYLALDKDAISQAIDSAEQLMKLGKDVYLVNLQEKDPSDLGFTKITELLHSAKQLTFQTLFGIKMGMI